MESLNNYIMERHAMPVLPSNKLKEVWKKMKDKLGKDFDDDLLDALSTSALNDALWRLETKYELGIMK